MYTKLAPAPAGGYRPLERMGIAELESLRVILRGGSVIDWRRLNFRDRAEVESYLRLNQFDHDDPQDERRLRADPRAGGRVPPQRLRLPGRRARRAARGPARPVPPRLGDLGAAALPADRLRRAQGDARDPPPRGARAAVPDAHPRVRPRAARAPPHHGGGGADARGGAAGARVRRQLEVARLARHEAPRQEGVGRRAGVRPRPLPRGDRAT